MQVCQHALPELQRLNPELQASVQCGDCIVLPHACLPRLYLTQRGDTWASIASWLQMPPARLRVRNREAEARMPTTRSHPLLQCAGLECFVCKVELRPKSP